MKSSNLPDSDAVFGDDAAEDEQNEAPKVPALAFMGKANVNERKLSKLKHFGLPSFNSSTASREAAASAATQDFFKV